MKRKLNRKQFISELDKRKIFTNKKCLLDENIKNLLKMQKLLGLVTLGIEDDSIRYEEIIASCMSKAREKNLLNNKSVTAGINSIRELDKHTRINISGYKAEQRVNDTLSHINRSDAVVFRNINISDGTNETELDNVVVTNSGIIIIESKSTKGNVTITENGLIMKDKICVHDYNVGEKMELKRNLLGNYLLAYFEKKNINFDLQINSCIVFSSPSNLKFKVIDKYHYEDWAYLNQINNMIERYNTNYHYDSNQLQAIIEGIHYLEVNSEGHEPKYNSDLLVNNIIEMLITLGFVAENRSSSKNHLKINFDKNFDIIPDLAALALGFGSVFFISSFRKTLKA